MHNMDVVVKIVVVILAAGAAQLLVRESINTLVRRAVHRGKDHVNRAEDAKREDTLLHVFRPLSRVLIWGIASIVVLNIVGVNLAALVTGAGALGLVFGIIAQSAFRDYIAGIYIIVENQYRVGDVVMLAGVTSGTVEDITIRITKLRDLDGNLHYVRNGDAGVITNMTSEWSRANIELHVGWGSDLDKVEEVINEVGSELAKDKDWREFIVEPVQFYRVDGFTSSSVIIRALGKTVPINQWAVAGEFRRRIKSAFDKHGIERPYPQRVVHDNIKQKKETKS